MSVPPPSADAAAQIPAPRPGASPPRSGPRLVARRASGPTSAGRVRVIRPQAFAARVRGRVEFGSHLGCCRAILGGCRRHQDGQQQAEGVPKALPLTTVPLRVAILAARFPRPRSPHCLGIDAARTGSGITSGLLPDRLPQGGEHLLPGAVVAPRAEGSYPGLWGAGRGAAGPTGSRDGSGKTASAGPRVCRRDGDGPQVGPPG